MNGTREPVPGGGRSDAREVAARIERKYPGWLVMWSLYCREFFAFPCFSVPQGTVLHYPDPGQLVAEMFSVQKAAAQASRVVAGSAGGGMWRISEGLGMGFDSANDEEDCRNGLGDNREHEHEDGAPGAFCRGYDWR